MRRLPWITWVSSKCHCKNPIKEAKGDKRDTEEKYVKILAKAGVSGQNQACY